MKYEDSHLSDQQILLELEGEISGREQETVRAHLDGCWKCRARRQEIETAITEFIRVHQREFDGKLPPAAGPRALLKAELARLAEKDSGLSWFATVRRSASMRVAAALALAAVGLLTAYGLMKHQERSRQQTFAVSIPDLRLTPGAATLANRQAVCSEQNVKNKTVSAAVQRKVFEEYGIPDAHPEAYEVDYLVTPALGGTDDVRNLWPQPYSATWNARVKDALEDRLRDMVCDGSLDLAQAQREIATDWIAAYKKYFHTEQPSFQDH